MKVLWLIFVILLIDACIKKNSNLELEKINFDSLFIADPQSFLVINKPAVIETFYLNDFFRTANFQDTILDSAEIWIEKNRQKYYHFMDSYGYYSLCIRKQLDSMQVPYFKPKRSIQYLKFLAKNKKEYFIELNTYRVSSGVFIFNGIDKPVRWETISKNGMLEDSLKKYFINLPK